MPRSCWRYTKRHVRVGRADLARTGILEANLSSGGSGAGKLSRPEPPVVIEHRLVLAGLGIRVAMPLVEAPSVDVLAIDVDLQHVGSPLPGDCLGPVEQCGADSDRKVDLDAAGEALAIRRMPRRPCPRSAGTTYSSSSSATEPSYQTLGRKVSSAIAIAG